MGDGVNIAARLEGIASPGAICLSEDAYRQVKARLDLQVSDLGATQLKNIEDPLRVYSLQVGKAAQARPSAPVEAKAEDEGLAFPTPSDKPSIAVLPFQNMSGDPEQEFFADGLVEDIITTLSKLPGLTVIARNSSFAYKGRAVDLREVGQQLGVRYLLEGSVRRGGDRIRVTAQLIDARTGSHLWAERYDRPLDDIFAVQDEITLVLATEMQVKLTDGEQARLRYTSTGNVEAWSLWMQGLSFSRQAVNKENWTRALALWQKALALDPDSSPLNAMVGLVHVADARFGWLDDRPTALAKARRHAEKALSVDPENADAHITAGYADMIEGQWDNAVAHVSMAIEAAPLSADAATLASFILACAGRPRESAPLIERAIQLSPHYPSSYLGNLGNAYRLTGRFEEAIAAFKAYDARSPGFGLTDLVIAYQQTNRPEHARQTAERFLALRPTFTGAGWLKMQFRRDQALLAAEASALIAAGLPSG
jgi:adenylate cyclase